jgi:4-oxalocrotonate tautomerase
MPIVHVHMLKGRSEEQRQQIAAGITRVMVESTGVDPGAVRVLIDEIEPSHWYTAGVAKAPATVHR